jgi:pyruvyltransferase
MISWLTAIWPRNPAKRIVRDGAIHLYWASKTPNFGDIVSPLIVGHLSGRPILPAKGSAYKKLLAVGSIARLSRRGDVIWGSGFIAPDDRLRSTRIDVLAVRGPLTRKRMLALGANCPEIYGDPALFLPEVFPAEALPEVEKRPLGIIPHHLDKSLVPRCDPRIRVIDLLHPPERVLSELLSCERIVSSSLHGIVAAEAYGIPADWAVLSQNLVGGAFKFHDYYLGTNREPPEPLTAASLLAERVCSRPRFNREELLSAFPLGG